MNVADSKLFSIAANLLLIAPFTIVFNASSGYSSHALICFKLAAKIPILEPLEDLVSRSLSLKSPKIKLLHSYLF